jgi:hypothetical protein
MTLRRNEVDQAWKWLRKQDAGVVDVTGKAATTRGHLRPSGSQPLPSFPSAYNTRLPSSPVTPRSDTYKTAFNGEINSAA